MRGISFSAPMVPRVLDGSKSQTRRIVRCSAATVHGRHPLPDRSYVDPGPSPAGNSGPYLKMAYTGGDYGDEVVFSRCYPTYAPGETLYVKETLHRTIDTHGSITAYVADGAHACLPWKWRVNVLPGRFMPAAAARAWVHITGVRIERVQSISDADAIAEGIRKSIGGMWCGAPHKAHGMPKQHNTATEAFADIWNHVNGRGAWARNDWVFIYEFERASKTGERAASQERHVESCADLDGGE